MTLRGKKRICRYCKGVIIEGVEIYTGITWHNSPVCGQFKQLIITGGELSKTICITSTLDNTKKVKG